MEETKLKNLFEVLVVIISVFSILGIIMEKWSSDCQLEIYEMNINLTQLNYWSVLGTNYMNFLMTNLIVKNYSKMDIESETIAITPPESARNLTQRISDSSADTQQQIFNLTKKIDEKIKECEYKSSWENLSLSIELIFAISCLFIATYIFNKSKK